MKPRVFIRPTDKLLMDLKTRISCGVPGTIQANRILEKQLINIIVSQNSDFASKVYRKLIETYPIKDVRSVTSSEGQVISFNAFQKKQQDNIISLALKHTKIDHPYL